MKRVLLLLLCIYLESVFSNHNTTALLLDNPRNTFDGFWILLIRSITFYLFVGLSVYSCFRSDQPENSELSEPSEHFE